MKSVVRFLFSLRTRFKFYKHRLYIRSLVARGLRLGSNVTIATTASLDDEYCYLIAIGDNCTISHHVRILAHDATTFKFTDGYCRIGKVDIKDNCYFGENVLVLPGVTIGPNVLVAAGSVVNKDIPANSCVAGVPARFYAKFDEFIEGQKDKITDRKVFNYADIFCKVGPGIKEEVIESVQHGDAYVKGYIGKFPTTFNCSEKMYCVAASSYARNNDLMKLHPWMLSYIANAFKMPDKSPAAYRHIFFCICDHFEPLGGGASKKEGLERVKEWSEAYPRIAARYHDSDGLMPQYTFFYPSEEYQYEYLTALAELCHSGHGEVEIHLHHQNDTSDGFRKNILHFRDTLAYTHNLLSKEQEGSELRYGFIHGNWALDNSHPQGLYCGVNDEIDILQETGCYADFTMPSAPDRTQTITINSIYYALDDPRKPKSHNRGVKAAQGVGNQNGLLMVQGPLLLNWKRRKAGIFPRIENGFIGMDNPISKGRIALMVNAGIHLKGKPEYIFVKLYTHGCQEKNSHYLLRGGLDNLFSTVNEYCSTRNDKYYFVTARQMVNVIRSVEDGIATEYIKELRDYRLKLLDGRIC